MIIDEETQMTLLYNVKHGIFLSYPTSDLQIGNAKITFALDNIKSDLAYYDFWNLKIHKKNILLWMKFLKENINYA